MEEPYLVRDAAYKRHMIKHTFYVDKTTTATRKNVISIYLIPMLRTSPIETSSSIAWHVVSNETVVSMSSTLSSPRALEVVPTPEGNQNALFSETHTH